MTGLVGLCYKPQPLVIIIIIIITDKAREVKEGGEGKKGKGRGREMEGRLVRGGRGGKREREGPPGYYGFPPDLGVLEYSH